MRPVAIRPMRVDDLERILELNQSAVEGVASVDLATLHAIFELADDALVALDDDGQISGFVITVAKDQPYWSPNYAWFAANVDGPYVYLDRIVVRADQRRTGIASALYARVEAHGAVALEVYAENDVSLAFHGSRGFVSVGTYEHSGHVNVMMVRPADPH
jgi:predicted GNAT superfamily acetyltransferase